MRPILFNGKFLSAEPTGVHRVAEELIRAVDRRLGNGAGPRATLLHPRDAQRRLGLRHIESREIGRLTWQAWEQAELPRLAGEGLLINLCNLGPVMRRDQITMMHDAQVHETPRSYAPAFRAYYRALQPALARRGRGVVTVSNYAAAALERYGVAADARVIPNGCDHALRAKRDTTAAARRGLRKGRFVLAQGSAQFHKNVPLLVEAFRAPRLSGFKLALFGVEDLCAIHPDPPPNVLAIGRVSDAVLFGLMGDALAFACPSRTEGFGLPSAEAMALGSPVVSAPRGAAPEVLGEAALYASPDRPEDWVDALDALAADPALVASLTARGKARASRFTWDRAAGLLLDYVAELEGEDARCAA